MTPDQRATPDHPLSTFALADPGDLAALRARLAGAADSGGLLDVAYRTVDSPIGTLLLAATPTGLVRVAFESEGFDTVLQHLADDLSPRVLEAPRRLDGAARQLHEYFAGRRSDLDVPIDLSLSRGFRRTVLSYLSRIGFGRTASYAEVAAAVANPRAVRAVGTACATNPLPLVLPCHRVIRSDGRAGSYRGGPEAKQHLLDLEAPA
jgi:methylated-DNA-[protein]-cysteine S-methyltransferase